MGKAPAAPVLARGRRPASRVLLLEGRADRPEACTHKPLCTPVYAYQQFALLLGIFIAFRIIIPISPIFRIMKLKMDASNMGLPTSCPGRVAQTPAERIAH